MVSLPLVSRPATAVLDLPVHGGGAEVLGAEWLYLLVVLLGFLLALYMLFRQLEGRWLKLR